MTSLSEEPKMKESALSLSHVSNEQQLHGLSNSVTVKLAGLAYDSQPDFKADLNKFKHP